MLFTATNRENKQKQWAGLMCSKTFYSRNYQSETSSALRLAAS